jgi:hypothetical protein
MKNKSKIVGLVLGLTGLLFGLGLKTPINNPSTVGSKVADRIVSIKKVKQVSVSTYSDFVSALENADSDTTIVVTKRIEIQDEGVVLDGHDATIQVQTPYLNESGEINSNRSQYGVFANPNNTTLKNMTIMGGEDDSNGAIYNQGTLIMENVTLTRSNKGIRNYTGNVILKDCNIVRNVARFGAGITNSGGAILMDGCSLSENYSTNSGGGAMEINSSGTLCANNTIIANNSSSEIGGAINCYMSKIYLTNCTVTGNLTTRQVKHGGGIGINGGNFYAANSIIVDNYATFKRPIERSDIGLYEGSQNQISLYNCIYGDLTNKDGSLNLSNANNCIKDTQNKVATSYRNSGIRSSDGITTAFNHPVVVSKMPGKAALYMPVSTTGKAATGGINTYFDYSSLDNIKMGYGSDDNITAFTNLGTPSVEDKVTTYYEGNNRLSGVIGASGPDDSQYYTVTLGTHNHGLVKGATVYGDAYREGSTVKLIGYGDEGYALENWSIVGSSTNDSHINPLAFNITEDVTINATFNNGSVVKLTYDANGGNGSDSINYLAGDATFAIDGSGFSRVGCTFANWNTEADGSGTSYAAGDVITLTDNMTLYAKWQLNANIANTIGLIDNINIDGTLADFETSLENAENAYNELTDVEKSLVSNISTLEAYNASLDKIKDINTAIDAIGNVDDITLDNENDVVSVRNEYNTLSDDVTKFVNNYSKLTAAETALANIHEKIDNVKELIASIGEVSIDNDAQIQTIRSAYDALNEKEKALVTNYETLTNAETTIANIHKKIDNVKQLIASIGEVSLDDSEKIEAARAAYNSLSEKEKLLVGNYQELTTAETTYEEIVLSHSGLPAWAIVLIVLGSIVVLCSLSIFLLFFVFNKWVVREGKIIRVIVIGKGNNGSRVLSLNCKTEMKKEEEIFKTKTEAEEFLNK